MKTKKKILWVHNFSNQVGAGGVWMYNQYEYLKDEVDLYYLDNMRNPLKFVLHFFRLRKLAKSYDLVHAQYGSANGFLTSLVNCKRILSLKGSDWYVSPSSSLLHRIRIFLGGLLTKFSVPRFQHIIVMSHAMKREVLQKFPEASVEVIVDPIDLSKFKPIDTVDQSGTKRVLFASVNLKNPIKRFALAKESFELLHKKMPNTELVTMSNIPHGEVNKFMNGTDVLLLTSVYEGWPNVVKEILACNKPFVSTKVSDLELLAKRTVSCFACEDSAEALSEALYKALHAPPEDLRSQVAHFNMEKNLAKIQAIYLRIFENV